MSNRTPVGEAFVYLAQKLSRAIRIKERVAAQGGDLDQALGNVQEIENEASACFILARAPEGMGR
jgi:hypothetical protein